MADVKRLGYMVDGEWKQSKSDTFLPITDSNTGEVIAETPMCTEAEVTEVAGVGGDGQRLPTLSDDRGRRGLAGGRLPARDHHVRTA